jgi:hypothetical protein
VVHRLAAARGDVGLAGMEIALEVLDGSRDLVQGAVLVRRDEPDAAWARFMSEVQRLAAQHAARGGSAEAR